MPVRCACLTTTRAGIVQRPQAAWPPSKRREPVKSKRANINNEPIVEKPKYHQKRTLFLKTMQKKRDGAAGARIYPLTQMLVRSSPVHP
jgi:hypothetical protein